MVICLEVVTTNHHHRPVWAHPCPLRLGVFAMETQLVKFSVLVDFCSKHATMNRTHNYNLKQWQCGDAYLQDYHSLVVGDLESLLQMCCLCLHLDEGLMK